MSVWFLFEIGWVAAAVPIGAAILSCLKICLFCSAKSSIGFRIALAALLVFLIEF